MATTGDPNHLRHRPIMVAEVLAALRPGPGEVVVDCTIGGGGHAEAILPLLSPSGHYLGLDRDPAALARTEARLRALGFGEDILTFRHASFSSLLGTLVNVRSGLADGVLVDLGISTMQADDPGRGFNHRLVGPLDMRMDQTTGPTAAELVRRATIGELEASLVTHADEPHASIIAAIIAAERPQTTHALERVVRTGLARALPTLTKPDIKMSVRRTFQAIRILVNDEHSALEALLAALPSVLAPGGRAAVITFHSGEDRLVKRAFREGLRSGVYASVSRGAAQSSRDESFANRRSRAAKLRWAIRV